MVLTRKKRGKLDAVSVPRGNEKEYSTYLPYSSSYNSVYFIFRFVNVMGLVGHLNGEHSCAIDSVERTFGVFMNFLLGRKKKRESHIHGLLCILPQKLSKIINIIIIIAIELVLTTHVGVEKGD